jgi:hypothetical protein
VDDGDRLVEIYLQDHLAGSVAALELIARSARSNEANELGAFLTGLHGEIREDKETLLEVMGVLGVEPSRQERPRVGRREGRPPEAQRPTSALFPPLPRPRARDARGGDRRQALPLDEPRGAGRPASRPRRPATARRARGGPAGRRRGVAPPGGRRSPASQLAAELRGRVWATPPGRARRRARSRRRRSEGERG